MAWTGRAPSTSKVPQISKEELDTALEAEIDGKVPYTGMYGFKNLLINGGFDVWQRGTSFTTTGYTADRWSFNLSGAVGTITQETFAQDQSDVLGVSNFLKMNITTGNDYCSISQRIENLFKLAGQTITISFKYKLSGKALNSRLVQTNEAGGVPSSINSITLGTLETASIWTTKTFTVDVPLINPSWILGNGHNTWFIIEQGGGDVSTTPFVLEITNIQLEEGSIATPFEQRPIGLEMSLCQRYYQAVGDMTGVAFSGLCIGVGDAANNQIGGHTFNTTMRTDTPTITIGTVKTIAGGATTGSPASSGVSKNGFTRITGVTVAALGQPYRYAFTADAEL